jgi:cytochrome c
MKFAAKSTAALAPVLLALAACGGGAEEAEEPSAGATTKEEAAPADAATPAPDATPTPVATPSESPSPTPPATAAVPPPAVAAASPPTVFNQCTACHSTDRGENGIGPSLAGVFGRRAGTAPGFEYSQAMKDAGLTWTQANLDRFLENPRGVVPGTTMTYNGVKDAGQRQAVINYLKTL